MSKAGGQSSRVPIRRLVGDCGTIQHGELTLIRCIYGPILQKGKAVLLDIEHGILVIILFSFDFQSARPSLYIFFLPGS